MWKSGARKREGGIGKERVEAALKQGIRLYIFQRFCDSLIYDKYKFLLNYLISFVSAPYTHRSPSKVLASHIAPLQNMLLLDAILSERINILDLRERTGKHKLLIYKIYMQKGLK